MRAKWPSREPHMSEVKDVNVLKDFLTHMKVIVVMEA